MVAEICQYIILGHSERRTHFMETDTNVNRKVQAALLHGLTPIVCVGETLEENETGRTREVVSRQIKQGLVDLSFEEEGLSGFNVIIAYEPVWAIGTGRAATAEGANAVIARIVRPALAELFGQNGAQSIRVLYGGSVNSGNAAEFFAQPDIDGALVGGASLKVGEFIQITQSAAL